MKRTISVFVSLLFLTLTIAGCGGSTADTNKTANPASPTAAVAGVKFESDKFLLIVPTGWQQMNITGGVQLYKASGEILEVSFQGFDQTADSAKQQIESNAKLYNGTAPQEVQFLGNMFWTTTYTAAGVSQVSYLRIQDGVTVAVKYGGPGYDTNPEFTTILNSIVFK